MEQRLHPHPEEKIACTSCMKDIPFSAATSAESAGYTLYFCGLECYSEWHRQAERGHFTQAQVQAAR
jgi:YHS domain-containing protein